jgi:hypothetical protein
MAMQGAVTPAFESVFWMDDPRRDYSILNVYTPPTPRTIARPGPYALTSS